MKVPATSISFALLFFVLSLENASASFFSFGNLMFRLNVCQTPSRHCHLNCKGPLRPKNYCDNQCVSSSTRRRLDDNDFSWSEAACSNIRSSSAREQCMAGATADCVESDLDSDASYADASNYSPEANSSEGVPIASRLSLLPYIFAATVATMFLMIYVWRKRSEEQRLRNEDLLADDEGLHGAVAQRLDRARTVELPTQYSISEEGITGYALA